MSGWRQPWSITYACEGRAYTGSGLGTRENLNLTLTHYNKRVSAKSSPRERVVTIYRTHQALDEACVGCAAVHHVHFFDHVQVDWLARYGDGQNGLCNNFGKLFGQSGIQLGLERSTSDVAKQGFICHDVLGWALRLVEGKS